MQGYQFGHIETWSRKGVAKEKGKEKTVRRNGQRGWTVEQILAEAEREPGASEHVGIHRRDPTIIAGSCTSFKELRTAHKTACAVDISVPHTDPKTGKKSKRKRSVRQDTHTLYAAIVSLPRTSADALADPQKMAECQRAFDLVIAFETRRLTDAGGEFAMAVIHTDEKQIHLHIFGLDRQRGSVNALHPGKAALDAFRARHGAMSRKGSDLFQRSKRAYCDAMREWQDDLHDEALGKVGLCRLGPGRFRYSRSQYVNRKREEEESAQAKVSIENASKIRAGLEAASEIIVEREDNLIEEQERLNDRQEKLKLAQTTVAEKEQRLDAGLATIDAMSEGFLEAEYADGETTVRSTKKAKQEPSRWRDMRKHLARAPDEVLRIGAMIGASLRKLRAQTVAEARESARQEAHDDIAASFPGLRAVHTFALSLIGRLGTPEDRSAATAELQTAAKSQAGAMAKFRRHAAKDAQGNDPKEG